MSDNGLEHHFTIADAVRRLSASGGRPFTVMMERGACSVEFFMPKVVDIQKPHDRDEIYVIVGGQGTFVRGDDRRPAMPGDLIFVPKGEVHRFESFTEDFATWVIFF